VYDEESKESHCYANGKTIEKLNLTHPIWEEETCSTPQFHKDGMAGREISEVVEASTQPASAKGGNLVSPPKSPLESAEDNSR
jgi:hypothetical protein